VSKGTDCWRWCGCWESFSAEARFDLRRSFCGATTKRRLLRAASSKRSASKNTSTKEQSHYPGAPNVNCALRSLCWGIPRWFCWTNRRLEWTRRPSDSCGGCDCVEATATFKWLSEITGSSDSFCVFLALCAGTPSVEHSKVRIAEPSSLHITWKKLTLCARG